MTQWSWKVKLEKDILPCVFSSFCLSQGYEYCTLVINDYYIVYLHVMLNKSTFSRMWKKRTISWCEQYPEYKPSFVDYWLQIVKNQIFIVSTHS